MSSLVEREPRKGERVSVQEFLGARERLRPTTEEGTRVIRYWVSWRNEPPYLHEETLFFAWIRSIEEAANGGARSQHYQDLSTLLSWISSRPFGEPMVFNSWLAKRTTMPPLLSAENRRKLSLQASRTCSFCDGGSHDQEAIAMLEEDLGILRQAKILTLSTSDMRQVIARAG